MPPTNPVAPCKTGVGIQKCKEDAAIRAAAGVGFDLEMGMEWTYIELTMINTS